MVERYQIFSLFSGLGLCRCEVFFFLRPMGLLDLRGLICFLRYLEKSSYLPIICAFCFQFIIGSFVLLLIKLVRGLHPHFFKFFSRKSHLIGLPPIFLEHGGNPPPQKPNYASLPKIEACFVMLCHASHGTSKIDGSSTMAKLVYGTKKMSCYLEPLWEHIVNLGNILRT